MRRREFHTFSGGGGSPPMQRNNNQGYDLSEESPEFLDLSSLSWSSGRPKTPPSPDIFLTPTAPSPDKGKNDISRHIEDMRRRTHEADFAATFQAHCDDGSAYATYEDLSMLNSPSAESIGESNSPAAGISGSGTPMSPTTSGTSLLDDSTRILNLSIESVLIAVAAESAAENAKSVDLPRYELDERPLERSRSLENVHMTGYALTLAKERHSSNDSEMNNNHHNVQRGNTSACAADTNLLRELGPRAATDGEESDENTTSKASRVVVVEPLIERSFRDVDETCLVTPARDEHSPQTTTQSHRTSHVYDDGYDDDDEKAEETPSDDDGDKDVGSANHRINPGIIYPSSAVVVADNNSSKAKDLVLNNKEVVSSSSSSLLLSSGVDNESRGIMAETKMMATMPHDLVPVAHNESGTAAASSTGTHHHGADVSPEIPSIASILEAIRNNQTEQIASELLAVEERLNTAECMADDLLDQNQSLRSEVKDLELEIEEAKDHYRQADIEEYRDIKADLDRAIKDYRVLQYRLRKAERKSEDAENQKQHYEDKLKAAGVHGSGNSSPEDRSSEMIGLSQELKVAKEVSIRLHQELEMIEDKRSKTEDENQILRRKLVESEAMRKDMKRDLDKTRTEVDVLRRKLSQSFDDEKSKELKAKIQGLRSSASEDGDVQHEYDIAALLNDLQESAERERDMQNQLHLLDEEAAVIRKNIDSIEEDKEALEFELERFKMRFGTLDEPKHNGKGVGSEKEAELRLQLMMVEQEALVMRRRIVELESQMEELQGGPSLMETSVPEDDKKVLPQRQSPVGEESTELSKRMQDIEAETDALKRQLEQVLHENEALRVKLETFEELNTIYSVDAKEEHPDPQKKLLQAESVISTLKKRIVDVEFNHRCLQLESETLRKLSEVEGAKGGKGGKAKATENKLRAQVNVLQGEGDFMRKRIVELEIQNEHLHEGDDDGEGGGSAKKQRTDSSSSDGDSDRLAALQEKIGGLEEELGDLLLIVKSKEVTQEQQEKELIQAREDAKRLREETQARESLYQDQLAASQSQQGVITHQMTIVAERAQKLEEDLKRTSAAGQTDKPDGVMAEGSVTVTRAEEVFAGSKPGVPTVTVNYEKCLKDRIDSLEQQLAEERQRCRVAEKRAEMLNGDEGPSPISLSFDAAYKEREKELLRFELTECHLTIEDLKTEIAKEKEQSARERAEYEQHLREMAEDRGRTFERHALEKESSELQRKMESLAWRRERAALSKRVAQLKTKVVALQDRVTSTTASQADEQISEHEAKLRALNADAEKEELKSILEKLEAEVAILDNECWKYREVAEEMQARMNKLTAQNEELQASSDILTQERTLLHTKLATAQQDKSELYVKFKKDRDSWERERAEIRSTLAQQDMALKDAQCMMGRLQVIKVTLEKRNKELERTINQETEQAKQVENTQVEKEKETSAKPASEVPDGREFAMISKTRQLEELHDNLNRANLELDNGKERLRELEVSLRHREHTLVAERLELLSEASTQSDSEKEDSRLVEELESLRQKLQSKERDWRSERSDLRDAVDKLQTSLKAREATWESERSKLRADVKSLRSRQFAKEESWKAERAKFLTDVGELRKHLKERDSDLQKNRDLLQRLEAATELVESYKEGETKFKDERRRLLQQIEDKEADRQSMLRERDGLQRSLDNQQRRIEHARKEVQDQYAREEKIWKSEILASKFKLEAESKYYKDELARLHGRVASETSDKVGEQDTLDGMAKENDRLRERLDEELRQKDTERQEREREHQFVKKSKELMDEFQNDKRTLHQQLAEERGRFDTLQRTYAADKATWDVCRNEMHAKLTRLESQTKVKKVKKDDLQARLQASWEGERGEHRRLVSEANHNSLETQRQMDAIRNKKQREVEMLKERFEKERTEWRNEKAKMAENIRKLEADIRRLTDTQKRTTQLELRFQREREAWRRERNEAQRKLQTSLSTRRMEQNRLDAFFVELEQLKNPSVGREPTQAELSSTTTEQQFPRSKTPPPISPKKKPPPAPPPRTFRASAKVKAIPRAPERSSSFKEAAPVRQLLRQVSDPASLHDASVKVQQLTSGSGVAGDPHTFEEALKQIEMVQDDLTSYQVRIESEYAARLTRSKSHSDVYGKKAPVGSMRTTSSVRELSTPHDSTSTTTTGKSTSSVQILTTERAPFQTGDSLREVKIHSRSAEVLTQSPKHRPYAVTVGAGSGISKDFSDTRSIGSGPSSISSDGSRTPLMSDLSETSSAGSTPRGSPKKTTAPMPIAKVTYTPYGGYDPTGMLKETRRNGSGIDVKTDKESFKQKLAALNSGSHVDSTKKRFELAQKRASVPLPSSLHSSRDHSPSHSISSDSSDRGRHTDTELSMRSPDRNIDVLSKFGSLRDGSSGGKATLVTLTGGSAPSGLNTAATKEKRQRPHSSAPFTRDFLPKDGQEEGPRHSSGASKRGMEPIPLMRTTPSGRPFSAPVNPRQLATYKDEHLSHLPGQLPITKKMQEHQHQQRQVSVSPSHRIPAAAPPPPAAHSPNRQQQKSKKESSKSPKSSFFSSSSSSSKQQKAAQKATAASSQGLKNTNNNQSEAQQEEQRKQELVQKQQPLMHDLEQRLQQRRINLERHEQQQAQQQQHQQQQSPKQQASVRPQQQQGSPQQHKTTTVTKKETTIQATKVAVIIPTDPIPPPQQMHPPSYRPSPVTKQQKPPAVHQKPVVLTKPGVQPRPVSQTQVTPPKPGVVRKQQPPVPPAKPPRQSTTITTSASASQPMLSQSHRPPVKSSPWSVSPSVPLSQQRQQHHSSKSKNERPLSGSYKTNTLGSNSSGSKTPSPESEKKGGRGEKPLDRAAKEHQGDSPNNTKDEKRAPKITFDEMFPATFAPTLTAKFIRPRPNRRRPPSRAHRRQELRTTLLTPRYDHLQKSQCNDTTPESGAEEKSDTERLVKRLRFSHETMV